MQFHRNNITEGWQDLVKEFPEIFLEPSEVILDMFRQYEGLGYFPATLEECCNLRYGFECGIGWKNVIRQFCTDIRELVNFAKEKGHEICYKTFILKEKFGELRDQGDFYGADVAMYRDQYWNLSRKMETESLKTCETCGKPGKTRISPSGWYRTTCDDHQRMGFVANGL